MTVVKQNTIDMEADVALLWVIKMIQAGNYVDAIKTLEELSCQIRSYKETKLKPNA